MAFPHYPKNPTTEEYTDAFYKLWDHLRDDHEMPLENGAMMFDFLGYDELWEIHWAIHGQANGHHHMNS